MKTSCRQKAIANKPAFPQCLTICLCATLLCLVHNAVFAIDCPTCGAIDLPGLAMFCHECNADLHDPSLKIEQRQDSSLRIRLLYTGDHPDRIPPYGKLYVNGKYAGNIDMTEKEERDEDFVASWNEGLGREYTAIYEKNFNKIPSGVLKIEVEMNCMAINSPVDKTFLKISQSKMNNMECFNMLSRMPWRNVRVRTFFTFFISS